VYEIPIPPILGFLNFYTNASTLAFDPEFIVNAGTLNWNLGDGSNNVNANSFIHTYTTTGNKLIKVFAGTTAGASSITSVNMYQDNLVGTLDISGLTELGGDFLVWDNPSLTRIINPTSSQVFTGYYASQCDLTGILNVSGLSGLGGDFQVYDNPKLTQILNPDSSQAFTGYYAYNCDLSGTLNVSGLTGLGGIFYVDNNPNLTQILNPISSQIFTGYYADVCNLTGTLDVSGLTGLGGIFNVNNNQNLTQIKNPVSSEAFTIYFAQNCSLNGTLDISGLTGLGGNFQIQNNNNLTELILPTTLTQQFTTFNAKNCSLNTASIDAALLKLHNLFDASAPIANLIGNFDGTGNAWPADGSSNVDYLGIKSAFATAGKVADISINYPPYVPPVSSTYMIFSTEASTNTFDPVFTIT
jgi:hypothetical protein